ncbi:hypothetical protein FRC07_002391 [Ceratobasidium sp. 392]|nr:hypothetical protein FRC07_002391 [Ceratobasidium sp. 392]
MSALRAQSSTVSLPPREKMLARRRAKAIKLGHSIATIGAPRPPRRKAKTPAPTLAATRQRRQKEYAYFNRPDGYQVKQVVRRPRTPPATATAVRYLPGQEDIPHSDGDSDGDSDTMMCGGRPPAYPTNCEAAEGMEHELEGDTDVDEFDDDADADADGEDDDMADTSLIRDSHPVASGSNEASGHSGMATGMADDEGQLWPGNSYAWPVTSNFQSTDLIGNASADQLKELYGGLNDLALEDQFPTSLNSFGFDSIDTEHGTFYMRQLSDVTDQLQAPLYSHMIQDTFADHSPPVPALVDCMPMSSCTGVQAPKTHTDIPMLPPSFSRALSEPADPPSDSGLLRGYESDHGRPTTPCSFSDTDIGRTEFSTPPRKTQAKTRAARHLTIRLAKRGVIRLGPARTPTILNLRLNAHKLYKRSRKYRGRRFAPNEQPRRVGLRAGALSPPQQALMPLMELHVLKDMYFTNPWPEDLDQLILDAQIYAEEHSGVSAGPEVVTDKFKDTVLAKLSGLRNNPLAKVEFIVRREFNVSPANKEGLRELLSQGLFLYPTHDREPTQYFCVGALSAVVEVMLFESAKSVALGFMETLCESDNVVKCASWHRKLRDRSADARKGVPPATIALAATMMHWAFANMLHSGPKAIPFDEGHFQAVWEEYQRDLIALPHLGQLRKDMLDHLQQYYVDHWPAPERDEDDNSRLAW